MTSAVFRLGVISDTHGLLSSRALTAFKQVDLIIHAGDIGPYSILLKLESLAPVIAVRGNNDFDGSLKLVEKTWAAGLTILVAHTPQHLRRALAEEKAASTEGPLLVIHGHTHIPEFIQQDMVTIACPGSASYPRSKGGPTVMLLELSEGAILSHQLVSV
ncbi:MAG: YfcE family phosphodiesterase [Coriobacteriia bacterium]|nr:YfcE family phosphodiesterase [Coriobacteriia bacterium]